VYFPLSPCCTPATYEAGEKGDLYIKRYANGNTAVCSPSWEAALLYAASELGPLTILRTSRANSAEAIDCPAAVSSLEREHFGQQQSTVYSNTKSIVMPTLARIFRAAPPPQDKDLLNLRRLLRRYMDRASGTNTYSVITVGRWVRERSQAYAVVRVFRGGTLCLEEVLILNPLSTNLDGLVLGAITSEPVAKAVKSAVGRHLVAVESNQSKGLSSPRAGNPLAQDRD
jgi:hypothetical protein